MFPQIIETMSFTAEVSTFMEVLGPFYEPVHEDEENITSRRLRKEANSRNNSAETQLNYTELAIEMSSDDSSKANNETDNNNMLHINGSVNGTGDSILHINNYEDLGNESQRNNIGEGCNNDTINS